MTKFQKYFQEMLEQNKSLFDEFLDIHNRYVINPKKHQSEFNRVGSEVQEVIRKYENRLCSKSDNTGYGKFTMGLSEKFQAEIKKYFPKIDQIGVEL